MTGIRAGSAPLQEQSDQREGTTRLAEQSLHWEGTTRFRQSIRVHRQLRESKRNENIRTIVHLELEASHETSGRPREGDLSRYDLPTASRLNTDRQDTGRIAEPKTSTTIELRHSKQCAKEPTQEARVHL